MDRSNNDIVNLIVLDGFYAQFFFLLQDFLMPSFIPACFIFLSFFRLTYSPFPFSHLVVVVRWILRAPNTSFRIFFISALWERCARCDESVGAVRSARLPHKMSVNNHALFVTFIWGWWMGHKHNKSNTQRLFLPSLTRNGPIRFNQTSSRHETTIISPETAEIEWNLCK